METPAPKADEPIVVSNLNLTAWRKTLINERDLADAQLRQWLANAEAARGAVMAFTKLLAQTDAWIAQREEEQAEEDGQ